MARCAKNLAEFLGAAALWALGMVTAYPESWPINRLLAVAVIATIASMAYVAAAIWQGRKGDKHYFAMAFLTVCLTVTSLCVSAVRIKNGKIFLFCCMVVFIIVVGVFIWYKHKSRKHENACAKQAEESSQQGAGVNDNQDSESAA